MLQQIAALYLGIGLGFAIRSGWIGGIEMALAEAQAGIRQNIYNRVNTLAYFWDILVWPAIAASIISKAWVQAEIKTAPEIPPAQLKLSPSTQRRPIPPPPGGNAA